MATPGPPLDNIGTLADVELCLQAVIRIRPTRAADILNLEPGAILQAAPEMDGRIEVNVNKVCLALAKVAANGDKLAVRIIEFAGEG